MVQERRSNGETIDIAIRRSGIDVDDFRALYFRQDAENDTQIIKELSCLSELSEYPFFNSQSYLLKNVVNNAGEKFHVLLVPKNCPVLALDLEKRMGGEPDETMTYLVDVQRPFGSQRSLTWPVYTESCEMAEKIARKEVSRMRGWHKKDLTRSAMLVTPDAFYEQAKSLIAQGFCLPAAVLWIRDLHSYAIEMQGLVTKLEQPQVAEV